jgi:pimeloyl-ACP methyl ester carboxylesterase
MTEIPERSFILGLDSGGFHRIAWYRWPCAHGQAQATVLCVHGLTRNGRDFDRLAEGLVQRLPVEVVAVDIAGRGQSDWRSDPSCYTYAHYMADLTVLIARLAPERLFWVGTSMGGLLGLIMAAQSNTPVERLVLNDVGPFIPKAALERIASYAGVDVRFACEDEFAAHLRGLYVNFGVPDEAGWQHLIAHSRRRTPEGLIAYNYDPKIAASLHAATGDFDLWPVWERLRCPALVLRGESSDVLLPQTAEEMTRRGPRAKLVVLPGCGHAPSLMRPSEIDAIAGFLALDAEPAASSESSVSASTPQGSTPKTPEAPV